MSALLGVIVQNTSHTDEGPSRVTTGESRACRPEINIQVPEIQTIPNYVKFNNNVLLIWPYFPCVKT